MKLFSKSLLVALALATSLPVMGGPMAARRKKLPVGPPTQVAPLANTVPTAQLPAPWKGYGKQIRLARMAKQQLPDNLEYTNNPLLSTFGVAWNTGLAAVQASDAILRYIDPNPITGKFMLGCSVLGFLLNPGIKSSIDLLGNTADYATQFVPRTSQLHSALKGCALATNAIKVCEHLGDAANNANGMSKKGEFNPLALGITAAITYWLQRPALHLMSGLAFLKSYTRSAYFSLPDLHPQYVELS